MRTKAILLSLLLALSTLTAQGVEVFSRKLNSENGLPDNNVRSLAQDAKGFIWMGTPNGLYRYDGYFVTTYKYAETGHARLLNNNHNVGVYRYSDRLMLFAEQGGQYSVFDVGQNRFVDTPADEKQRMYEACRHRSVDEQALPPAYRSISSSNGGGLICDNLGNPVVFDSRGRLWLIDRKNGEVLQMQVFDEQLFPLVSSKKYKVISSEKDQLVWVSTNGCGLTVYDRRTGQQQHIRQASGLISTDYILDMCLDWDDNIWVADEFHGVVCLSIRHDYATVQLLNAASQELRTNQVYIMRPMADSTVLVANTKGDVWQADRHLALPSTPTYTGVDIHAVCNDLEGRVWIGTRQRGLMAGDGHWYQHQESDSTSVSANNIYYLACDNGGRIWVAPEDSHLDLAVPQADGTYAFRHFFSNRFSARVMYQDKSGVMWVGTKNGLYSFRPEQLLNDTSAYDCPLTGADLKYSDVSCIYEDSRRLLWVGTIGHGVYFIDNQSEHGYATFSNMTTADGLISNEVQSITEDANGVMWLATKSGVTCYNPRGGQLRYYYDGNNLLRNYHADNCAYRLPDGRLAFGTNAGIAIYQPDSLPQPAAGMARLAITDILISGESVTLMDDSLLSAAPGDATLLTLAHDQNTLTLRFSAFNYKASTTRYTYWLEGYDHNWSELTAYSFAVYKNLKPGNYVFHVRAYDNSSLANAERTLTIVVQHPWWQTWWAYLVYALVAVAVGYAVYRQLRTVYQLRRRISIEKELTELKLQFFTNISHEFRTPLTIIHGAMQRVNAQQPLPAALRQPLSSMDKSVARMMRLVNQLLEFRKMQNGKLRLALEETDVVALVKGIYQNFLDIAQNKHMGYTFLPDCRQLMVYVDQQHVDKMVYNLLSNAFKYTPVGGSVTVRVKTDNGRLRIVVEDTGVGIPREKQSQLFQRFMQSNFSSNSIGIGLNLSHELATVHHGTLNYAENVPRGSVFTIELPTDKSVYAQEDFLQPSPLITQSSTQDATQEEYREVAPEPMNDRTVLVVEDDSDVMDFMRTLLQPYFNLLTAMDGVEALTVISQQRPDLVVSDVLMPVMDGFELTSRLRQDSQTQDLPVVLLTALTADDKRLKGVERGADAYLTKPFDPQLLITTCRKLMEQRDRLRHDYAAEPAHRPAPPQIIVEERDKKLLDAMNLWLASNLSNPLLSVDDVATAMGYSRTAFFKKMKALTGQTPADYIRTLRMKRAAELLSEDNVTVSEVCYQVGISDPHYFAKVFKQQFGISPKKYQQGDSAVTNEPLARPYHED